MFQRCWGIEPQLVEWGAHSVLQSQIVMGNMANLLACLKSLCQRPGHNGTLLPVPWKMDNIIHRELFTSLSLPRLCPHFTKALCNLLWLGHDQFKNNQNRRGGGKSAAETCTPLLTAAYRSLGFEDGHPPSQAAKVYLLLIKWRKSVLQAHLKISS